MKKCLVFLFLMASTISFSQSKKEQIEQLTNRVDSLNHVLSSERSTSSQKVSEFNSTIGNLESKISTLNTTISNLNLELQTSKADESSKQTELNSKQQEITNLQAQVKQKTDSLALVIAELEKLKPAPKPVVTSNTNTNNSTNQSAQTSQTGGYKSVKIGSQTWMVENLNVERFRNGDLIPQAKTDEEWKRAGENKQPAWCYYDNDPKNGSKYGKLYNWYAVNDPRGLAPAGWHVPSDPEWTTLSDQLGNDAGQKMKSTSGWNGYGCKRCDGGSSQFKANCTSCKGTQANSTDPLSGNGTNSSGFSGLPGGYRYANGSFYYVGNRGYWWSSTENSTYYAYPRLLLPNSDDLYSYSHGKVEGLSVRCLRD
jgi:uncharacterized protein (TIGR02145 family)